VSTARNYQATTYRTRRVSADVYLEGSFQIDFLRSRRNMQRLKHKPKKASYEAHELRGASHDVQVPAFFEPMNLCIWIASAQRFRFTSKDEAVSTCFVRRRLRTLTVRKAPAAPPP
jgi:hypothetical protein